jgi:hypothetical protein
MAINKGTKMHILNLIYRFWKCVFQKKSSETSLSDTIAFDFWEDEREDIYQDYLEKTPE